MQICTCHCHTTERTCSSCTARWAHECRAKPTPEFSKLQKAPPVNSDDEAAKSLNHELSAAQLRDLHARATELAKGNTESDASVAIMLSVQDRAAISVGAAALERIHRLNERLTEVNKSR